MDFSLKHSFPWKNLETSTLILPSELLVYYLYRRGVDAKAKKESQEKEDDYFIDYYLQTLIKEKEVALKCLQK